MGQVQSLAILQSCLAIHTVYPVACIISVTGPDKHGALCLFICFNAAATSSILIQFAGPSLTVADVL